MATTNSNGNESMGCPIPAVNQDDIFRVIKSMGSDGGINKEDLALIMGLTASEVEPLIQSLQTEGAIYLHNPTGNYMPL
jgi:DNA-binding IclR family transcriptional regulator